MLLEHSNKDKIFHRHIDVFVDDSSLGITKTVFDNFDPIPTDPVQKGYSLYRQVQLNTQFYGRLIFTTEGLLTIHKCIAYILLFEWMKGTHRLQKVKHRIWNP